ncbi:MAG: acyl-CoA dehydrogenase [Chryseosolibacter sp.]
MEFKVPHPSAFVDTPSLELIRRAAASAEQMKDLHPDQLGVIYRNQWFKMFIPKQNGGLGLTLPEVLRVEEALSWADGSTGWVVTLCSGAGWFAGFLDPLIVKDILSDGKVCFAGSGATTGTANVTGGGYEISGLWQYASGSLHATVFTANCHIHEDGAPQFDGDGSPVIGTFWFHQHEVHLQRQWNSMGMIATASHSFEVKVLPVGEERRFHVDANHARQKDPVYQYPFMQLAEATLSINLSGMAVRFLDLCEPLFLEKMKRRDAGPKVRDLHQLIADTKADIDQYRKDFYDAVNRSWEICAGGNVIPSSVLKQVTNASHALAQRSLRLVDELYPKCGLVAARPGEEINRVWRNLHTASQHALFSMI